jgi:hypothetical protein
MDSPDDLLTTAEVAQIMRSPVSTLRYWRHLGTGPHSFRLGRRVVYRRADVNRPGFSGGSINPGAVHQHLAPRPVRVARVSAASAGRHQQPDPTIDSTMT